MRHGRDLSGPWKHLARRLVGVWCVVVLAVGTSGCVQRRLTVRTNPPGAQVYIDDYDIGTTPVSTSFIYYGTRKIRLVKDGYETLTVDQKISAPWYQYFPLDFVSENVWPGEIRDEQVFDYQLAPQRVVPTELLLERAENLRASQPVGIAPPGTGEIFTSPPPGVAPGTPLLAPSGPQLVPAPTGLAPAPPAGAYPNVPPPPPFSGTPRAPALQMTPGVSPGYVAPAPTSPYPPAFAPTQPMVAPPPVMQP